MGKMEGRSMNTFFISDTHFGHNGVTRFLKDDGSKLRPWDNIEDMDEALVANWNSVVRPQDKVYHLGDVVINRRALPTLARLNGDKVLIKGNHDVFRLDEYTPYFRDIRGSGSFDEYLLTHIPVHPAQLYRWKGNVHGHLHSDVVVKEITNTAHNAFFTSLSVEDTRYFNVGVEQPHMNFFPQPWEVLKKIIEERMNG
jgi:calcineurin-like phosphoesterase family protein